MHGVLHEAAHGHLFTRNKRINERLGNWFGAYVKGYSVDAYRSEHFKHHAETTYLVPEDGETAYQTAATQGDIVRGILKDLFLVTAFQTLLLRFVPKALGRPTPRPRPFRETAAVLAYSAVLWTGLAWIGSVGAVLVYWAVYLTLYQLISRIFVCATHGDPRRDPGLAHTDVTCNVLSPLCERFFFGGRMLMYHYDHHRNPHLPYREAEREALRRCSGPDFDGVIYNRSYFLSFFRFLFKSTGRARAAVTQPS
jgi:fatty acid desaturase